MDGLAGTEAAGWAQGEVIALVPDLISVLESETGRAIGTEELKYGKRTDTKHPHSVLGSASTRIGSMADIGSWCRCCQGCA